MGIARSTFYRQPVQRLGEAELRAACTRRQPYVAISNGFAYVAIILDAWSRRVVGFAMR